MLLRKAIEGEEREIQELTREYPTELGFVSLPEIREGIGRSQVNVFVKNNRIIGYVLYRTRKDNISTIYSIAVSSEHSEQGIGVKLLRSVPPPIKLKCPVDSLANGFYYSQGFEYQGTYQGRKRKLNCWTFNTLYVFCMGANQSFYDLANKTSTAYGSRLDHLKPFVKPIYLDMLDMDWKSPNFSLLVEEIQRLQPNRVILMDYESPQQKEEMLYRITTVRELNLASRIIIVSKFFDCEKDIPEDVVIGVSIPTKYAGYLPLPEQVAARRVHFLGGSTYQHRKYRKYYKDSIIESVDSNTLEIRAEYGDYYTTKGKVGRELQGQNIGMKILMEASMRNLKVFYGRYF